MTRRTMQFGQVAEDQDATQHSSLASSQHSPTKAISHSTRPVLGDASLKARLAGSQQAQQRVLPGTPSSRKEAKGSIRSILREPNTPGTGQSVRFFSKDAFKLISPNMSASLDLDLSLDGQAQDISPDFVEQIEQLTAVNSTGSHSCSSNAASRSNSLLLPGSSQRVNIFDVSLDMPAIPLPENASGMLSDDAIEVPDELPYDEEVVSARKASAHSLLEQLSAALSPPSKTNAIQPDYSQLSVVAPIRSSSPPSPVVAEVSSPLESSPVTRHDSTSYWTPRSLIPDFFASRSTPSSTFEAQQELITSLREQISVYQELNAKYQVDIDNRDEMVEILSMRVEIAETELESWHADEAEQHATIQRLKKQLDSLSQMCSRLELAELERSHFSEQGSITDEAGSRVLKTLRSRIHVLEEANRQLEDDLHAGRNELIATREELEFVRSNNSARSPEANEEHAELQEKVTALEHVDDLQRAEIRQLQEEVARLQRVNKEQKDAHAADVARMKEEIHELETKGDTSVDGTSGAQRDQIRMLQEELESQWTRTEKATDKIKQLEKENSELRATVEKLQEKSVGHDFLETIEYTKQELIEQINESRAVQQMLEEDKDQVLEELRVSQQQIEDLVQSNSDLQRQLEQIKQEQAFTTENVERLQHLLKERDREIEDIEKARQQHFTEMDSLRGRVTSADKEHARQLAERARRIHDLETELRNQMERSTQIMNETADRDVYLGALEERANGRLEENERMRRRVHELEQESAAKEMRLVELRRDNDRIRDDNANLNIALDSKQQELELIKRKLGVKGTGGATPAPTRNGGRETSIFGITPRPSLTRPLGETPSTLLGATPRASMLLPPSLTMGSKAGHKDDKMGPPTIIRPRQSVGSPTAAMLARPPPSTVSSTTDGEPNAPIRTTLKLSSNFDLNVLRDVHAEEKENYLPLRMSRRTNVMVPS
ncbi:hypothetical protein PIIN_00158 [Serendipita indica DSM 11827]|uniref:Myosin heavy chain n=1 Tax=Serendipita indica (strain DSM 11827) TaxID=1109443 RepID=G4T5A3_SERID|nr:hypothetical protein PIIN_00158 [Serendipita indica DSM 11827]